MKTFYFRAIFSLIGLLSILSTAYDVCYNVFLQKGKSSSQLFVNLQCIHAKLQS